MKKKVIFKIILQTLTVLIFCSGNSYAQNESLNISNIFDDISLQLGYGRIYANAGLAVDYKFMEYDDLHHFTVGLGIGVISMYQYDKSFMGSAFVKYSLALDDQLRLTLDFIYGSVAEEKGSKVVARYDESTSSYTRTVKGKYYKDQYAPSLIAGFQVIFLKDILFSSGMGVSFLDNPDIFKRLLWEHIQFQIGCGYIL